MATPVDKLHCAAGHIVLNAGDTVWQAKRGHTLIEEPHCVAGLTWHSFGLLTLC